MFSKVAKQFSSVRLQLVASVFIAIAPALFLTYLVNQEWFWDFSPDWLKQYATQVPWASLVVGLVALLAAWFGGENFILRQTHALSNAVRRLAKGDLTARADLQNIEGKSGELVQAFDALAASLQKQTREREETEKKFLYRALQQTVVASLGQLALTNSDLSMLLNQAVVMIAQTMEVQYSAIYERLGSGELVLQAGTGWKPDYAGDSTVPDDHDTQIGYTFQTGEPVVIADAVSEPRFPKPTLLVEHGVVSSATVVIPTREKPFGVLGVHTTQRRDFTSDEVQFLLAIANVIAMAAERKRADAILQKLAAFARLNPNAALELTVEGKISYFNEAALELALAVQKSHPQEILPPDVTGIIRECLVTGRSKMRQETKSGNRTFMWSFHPVVISQVVHCYIEDITDRLSLEEQLRQAQKMESVGQLAAGVAHDFNNMLTIIQGHSSTLLARKSLPTELTDPVQAVYFAAERAASLTKQLLMFSRKNVMQIKPLDLRETVGNMSKMLQRLLGETISLRFDPPPAMPLVQGDGGMVEQVIMNLAVNARDAMVRGGELVVSLEAVFIDDDYTSTRPEARTGYFARLRVRDTGCGMDAQTMLHIFEPFFTTKEVGKGTGLGLATVYGIVKQHYGWIEVNSETGKGTTFDVFFPAENELASGTAVERTFLPTATGGTETILMVEDEPVLREMARDILEGCGYRILEAASGRDALKVWQEHLGKIDLLLTDMVMPEGVSGVELAEALLHDQPNLRIVFTSGYTPNEVSSKMLERNHAKFLQKPYSHNDLAGVVREILDKTGTADGAPVVG
jgi:signal transduction histidine kinase/CheY-like chemotaxis protein/HAMP domain-containing protein